MDSFPFRTSLSLERLVDFWVGHRDDPESPWAAQAREVLDRLDDAPELRGPCIDPGAVASRPELLRLLMTALFPPGAEGVLGAAGAPFRFGAVYLTPEAERLGVFDEDVLFTRTRYDRELMLRGHVMAAYEQVLRSVYGVDVDFDPPLVVTVDDPDTGLQRHFQMVWDSRFMTVTTQEGTRRATPEELDELVGEPLDLELWARVLPPERFEIGGLSITRAVEVTQPESSSLLKEALLGKDALSSRARVEELETHIRTLLGQPDVEMGLIAFTRDADIDEMDRAFAVGKSLLLCRGQAPECPQRHQSTYARAFRTGSPQVFRDLAACDCDTGFERTLRQDGIRSLALLPLFVDDRPLGLLEVASPTAGALTVYRVLRLEAVTPAFATALQRTLAEREDRIQSIIKQNYTAIHPAVEWRFREAAAHWLEGDGGEAAERDQIVFDGVYPLYGLTDIRGSSDTRSAAIQADLSTQLGLAGEVVVEAGRTRRLPALDEIAYRMERLRSRIEEGLLSEDEGQVLEFLGEEFEPLLDELARFGGTVEDAVGRYRDALDPNLGVVYRQRRDFEVSVARFNDAVCSVVDREQAVAQEIFPHFFERFKTDGVDHNIYIGDSIAEKGGFSTLYLHNLRLWQLQLVSRIEWRLELLAPEFEVELLPTHLVLVQDHPLSIRFRVDEKRFDVDGAYNIRYELVKKRIDKARVRETGERLTQPGTLSVVYSHPHEGAEYRRYLRYLIATGFYSGEIEEVALEDTPGVKGLRAFRVAVNRPAPDEAFREELRPTAEEVERAALLR